MNAALIPPLKAAVFGLLCLAAPVQADSLCGATDKDVVFAQLAGEWALAGGLAFQAQGDTMIERIGIERSGIEDIGIERLGATVFLNDLGMVYMEIEGVRGDNFFLRPSRRPIDGADLDDNLERVDAMWIAAEIADVSCDVGDLLQLRATSDNPNGDFNQVTLLPYATDLAVVIVEIESVQDDVGLAFITLAGLITRQ